jgi:hypothetical protein
VLALRDGGGATTISFRRRCCFRAGEVEIIITPLDTFRTKQVVFVAGKPMWQAWAVALAQNLACDNRIASEHGTENRYEPLCSDLGGSDWSWLRAVRVWRVANSSPPRLTLSECFRGFYPWC